MFNRQSNSGTFGEYEQDIPYDLGDSFKKNVQNIQKNQFDVPNEKKRVFNNETDLSSQIEEVYV